MMQRFWPQVLLFFIACVIGAAIVIAGRYGISIDTVASLGVAAGTMALAYFTWESLTKTNEVIKGEDRRHQQGYAPALVVATLSGSAGAQWEMSLQNKGLGPAKNIRVSFDGVWFKVLGGQRLDTPLSEGEKYHALSFLKASREEYGTFVFGQPSDDKQGVVLSSILIGYEDMFGNEYWTHYPKGIAEFQRFEWIPPDNLKIPRGPTQTN
jgi:hypothetical protein